MRERRPDLVAGVLRHGFDCMVRHGLRGVWWRGDPPAGPFVWAANHHSWWDPFLAAVLLDRLRRSPCLIMHQRNLERYGFVRRLGVFGTEEHRRGLGYLRAGRVLVIYPEGELRPAGAPGALAAGAAWYAVRAPAPLCAVATRVLMRGQQAPEAYLSLHTLPAEGSVATHNGRLAKELAGQLAALDRLNATADPRRPLPGFIPVRTGRRSWDERIDRIGSPPWR